jgi:hypothetical protein
MHWACVECLVRPMCSERCDRTYYKHYLCEKCNDCNRYPCDEVKKLQMYERLWMVYGDKIIQAWNDQPSIFSFLKPPKKSFNNWWVTKGIKSNEKDF